MSSLSSTFTPTAVALGNFDGLHRGHQRVIQPILNFASNYHLSDWQMQSSFVSANVNTNVLERNLCQVAAKTQNCYSTVITFNPHPREFLTGQRCALLTPGNEKVQQLLRLGVKQLVVLPFDRKMAALSPKEFVEKILLQQLHAQLISVGEDFCFGRQRSGTATDLQAIAAEFGIPVNIVPLHTCENERISSSSIRQALKQGDLQRAKAMLGRCYTLTGSVIQGQKLGRTIGFPTTNLHLPPEKLLPRHGVYAVTIFVEDGIKQEYSSVQVKDLADECATTAYKGIVNIGDCPKANAKSTSVEVHLLDWSGDLYGKTLTVRLEKFLRPEQAFASLEAFKTQIHLDCAIARA